MNDSSKALTHAHGTWKLHWYVSTHRKCPGPLVEPVMRGVKLRCHALDECRGVRVWEPWSFGRRRVASLAVNKCKLQACFLWIG